MILNKEEINWIVQHQIVISKILVKLIDDRTSRVIDEEDSEKRDKLINWVKELKLGQMILNQAKQNKKGKQFTGI